VDKVLIFTTEWLGQDSQYPQAGGVGCEILDQWQDASARKLVRITIDKPDMVESTEGISEFIDLSSQLRES
jgi:hypothetical protein